MAPPMRLYPRRLAMTTRPAARWGFRTVLTFLLALAGCLFVAGTARAGGPTSALLVSPSTDQVAAVYYSDAEYERLHTLLGGDSPEADPAATPSSHAGGGDYITVSWMIHDVTVWRIDRIFLGANEPWIVTQMVDGQGTSGMYPGEAGDGTAVTHRSPDPAALQSLLTSFGLLGPASGSRGAGDGASFAPVAAPAAVPAAAETAAIGAASVDARAGSPWWWALAGLAAGVLLTAIAVRYLPAVRNRLSDRAMPEQSAVDDNGLVRMTPLSS
jgi:hypothetical protein